MLFTIASNSFFVGVSPENGFFPAGVSQSRAVRFRPVASFATDRGAHRHWQFRSSTRTCLAGHAIHPSGRITVKPNSIHQSSPEVRNSERLIYEKKPKLVKLNDSLNEHPIPIWSFDMNFISSGHTYIVWIRNASGRRDRVWQLFVRLIA